jgi:bacteriocin biosynthesis cyclodehydratase domain-containing protein
VLVGRNDRNRGDSTHSLLEHRRELDGNIASGSNADFLPENWIVVLAGQGQLANAMLKSLTETGIQVNRVGAEGQISTYADKRAMMLVCSDDEDFSMFRKMNSVAVEAGMPSLFLGIDWSTVQCGPLVIPKATACYECFYHRVRSTRKFAAEFDVRSNPDNFVYRAIPSKLAIQWAVAEGARIVLQYLSGTLENMHQSTFSEIGIFDGNIGRSAVLRLPRCPVCGVANTARPVGTVYQHALMRRRA